MTGTIWLCLAEGDEHEPRIRAWTTDPKRAGQLRADGLDMVEYRPLTTSAPGEQQPVAYVSRLDLAKVRASGCVNTILTRDPQRPAEGIVPVYTSAPPAAGWDEAQRLISTMALAMQTALNGLKETDRSKEVLDLAQDSLERGLSFEADFAVKALRRESPACSGIFSSLTPEQQEQALNCRDDGMSRPDAGGGVRVKPLEWKERWSGSDEDIPCWRGENPLGLLVDVSFAGTYNLARHSDAPDSELAARKAEAQARYEHRILSALSTRPAAVESNDSAEERRGATYRVDYDGFVGTKIGTYRTREGREGVVLQQVDTKIVHVYGANRVEPVGDEAKKSEGCASSYLSRPDCKCFDEASRDYCLSKDKCRPMAKAQAATPSDPTADRRQFIIDTIREKYDPVPSDWLAKDAHRWDDGTGEIADAILAALDGGAGE